MVALGAGLSEAEYKQLQANMNAFVDGLPVIK